jgi:histidinol phosphatase-like PHP family hydrolase
MDLHLHTPASSDYQEPQATYLELLQRAEARGLDLIAFTDHNTVAGYRRLRDEIEELELLERLNRMRPEEKHRLDEYRRLLGKILVLPGFEFTATFGFHILGLFPPETPVRDLEHLLLSLDIPSDQLDKGSATVGATADVLTAYRLIDEAGGLAIAAHANSSNGVAMRGFTFGGQTKIAYTQDPHLHALEVTDLEQKGRRSTAAFFNGSKPEYPRRMHCIQGSDAHRLKRDPHNNKNLGVGDRATDILLDEVSFDALKQVFLGRDFARTRPHTGKEAEAFDYVQEAREEGPNIVQDFHESMTARGGKLYAVIADVCAFANTNGGTLYVGVSADPKQRPVGVEHPAEAVNELRSGIDRMLTPSLDCPVDTLESKGKTVIRILIPRGDDPPYAIEDNKIYVREEAETSLAVRDEIVQLVLRGKSARTEAPAYELAEPAPEPPRLPEPGAAPVLAPAVLSAPEPLGAPRTGVEVVATEERDGRRYHTVRDLRNGNTVKNVTRASARKLWHYAITEHESGLFDPASVTWRGDIGLWKKTHRGGVTRYDLVQRGENGAFRIYYGVTEDGVHGEWRAVVGSEEER